MFFCSPHQTFVDQCSERHFSNRHFLITILFDQIRFFLVIHGDQLVISQWVSLWNCGILRCLTSYQKLSFLNAHSQWFFFFNFPIFFWLNRPASWWKWGTHQGLTPQTIWCTFWKIISRIRTNQGGEQSGNIYHAMVYQYPLSLLWFLKVYCSQKLFT